MLSLLKYFQSLVRNFGIKSYCLWIYPVLNYFWKKTTEEAVIERPRDTHTLSFAGKWIQWIYWLFLEWNHGHKRHPCVSNLLWLQEKRKNSSPWETSKHLSWQKERERVSFSSWLLDVTSDVCVTSVIELYCWLVCLELHLRRSDVSLVPEGDSMRPWFWAQVGRKKPFSSSFVMYSRTEVLPSKNSRAHLMILRNQ